MQYYNPMMNYQQRLQQIEPRIGVVGRAVTCEQEAISAQIPFDATINVYTDLANGKIYVKTFNMQTGAADFRTFVYQQPPAAPAPPQYVTRDEFERFKEELLNEYHGNNQYANAQESQCGTGMGAGTANDAGKNAGTATRISK